MSDRKYHSKKVWLLLYISLILTLTLLVQVLVAAHVQGGGWW